MTRVGAGGFCSSSSPDCPAGSSGPPSWRRLCALPPRARRPLRCAGASPSTRARLRRLDRFGEATTNVPLTLGIDLLRLSLSLLGIEVSLGRQRSRWRRVRPPRASSLRCGPPSGPPSFLFNTTEAAADLLVVGGLQLNLRRLGLAPRLDRPQDAFEGVELLRCPVAEVERWRAPVRFQAACVLELVDGVVLVVQDELHPVG